MYEHWRTVSGLREFEYEYARVELWGRDLYSHLDDIYQNLARYCVIFLSKHYAQRVWTDHERRSAQARALREHAEYILPTRFDDTIVPGIRETVGYIDLRTTPPEELCRLIVEKIGPRPRIEYFPPVPDRLYKRVGAKGNRQKHAVSVVSRQFFETLQRMSTVERRLLYPSFQKTCILIWTSCGVSRACPWPKSRESSPEFHHWASNATYEMVTMRIVASGSLNLF